MTKKVVADKVELKTPISKKEGSVINVSKREIVKRELDVIDEESIQNLEKEILEQLQNNDETPKEPLKIFENGNVGFGDNPLDNLAINGTFLPLGELNVEIVNNEILEPIGTHFEPIETVLINNVPIEEFVLENILNSIDSIQTIERGKLDLVKELILNSQNLEAITLLKSIQTLEHGKVEEIISKL